VLLALPPITYTLTRWCGKEACFPEPLYDGKPDAETMIVAELLAIFGRIRFPVAVKELWADAKARAHERAWYVSKAEAEAENLKEAKRLASQEFWARHPDLRKALAAIYQSGKPAQRLMGPKTRLTRWSPVRPSAPTAARTATSKPATPPGAAATDRNGSTTTGTLTNSRTRSAGKPPRTTPCAPSTIDLPYPAQLAPIAAALDQLPGGPAPDWWDIAPVPTKQLVFVPAATRRRPHPQPVNKGAQHGPRQNR